MKRLLAASLMLASLGAFAHEPFEYVETDQIAIGALILARTIVDVLGVRELHV